MRRKPIPNGVVLWMGPSEVDGKTIVMVATCIVRPSDNEKTGPMIQIYMLLVDTPPSEAVKTGDDISVCGDCPARRVNYGSCYLVPHYMNNIYRAFHGGKYPDGGPEDLLKSRWSVRHGAWGNPSSVPFEANEELFSALQKAGRNWTAYEHNWKHCDQPLKKWCMASCDTLDEAIEAKAMGWRPFAVILPEEKEAAKEQGLIPCPFELHNPKTPQCEKCNVCDGAKENDKRPGISVLVHGAKFKVRNYKRMRESLRVIQ